VATNTWTQAAPAAEAEAEAEAEAVSFGGNCVSSFWGWEGDEFCCDDGFYYDEAFTTFM
jgi:hypothetical protein